MEAASSDEDEAGEPGGAGPQDPRAGRVDVTIPQLMVDYGKLSEELLAAGGDKDVGQPQRKVLYR